MAILEKPSHVSAGREIKVVCQSLGGYPPPKLTWWLGSKMLKSNEEVCNTFIFIYIYLSLSKNLKIALVLTLFGELSHVSMYLGT